MSDTMDFAQWARNWEAMAREYLAKMPSGAPGSAPWAGPDAAVRQWQEGVAQWTQPMAGQSPQSDLMERLMSGAQGYLGMLQGMAASAGGSSGVPVSPWFDALRSSLGTAPAAPSWFSNPVGDVMRGFGGHGAQGFEQMMQRFASAAAPILGNAKELLSLPAFGHLRQHQENAQGIAKAMIEYQEQTARYNRIMLKVSEQGFARFQLKLAEREEPGRQIDSVRGIYDLWIDAAEEAYAEIALSEEFREIYGDLVNAQMRVRGHVQREVERLSNDLGIPTRSEIDSIGERLQALRRAFREERESAPDIAGLATQVAELREQLAALSPRPASNVVAFGRPAARRRASTTTPRAPRKVKSVRQVVRAASKATPSGTKSRTARKSTRVSAAPAPDSKGSGKDFAAQMARFARANTHDAPPSAKPKSGKR